MISHVVKTGRARGFNLGHLEKGSWLKPLVARRGRDR